MQTPQPVTKDAPFELDRNEVLSTSAIERALRRATNPSYSGSPSRSEQSLNGVQCTSTPPSVANENPQTGRTAGPGGAVGTRMATLQSADPITASSTRRPANEVSPSEADHVAFRLNDAEFGSRVSSLSCQGGDSAAASLFCSLNGQGRHSLCTAHLNEAAHASSVEPKNTEFDDRLAVAFNARPAPSSEDASPMTGLYTNVSETGLNASLSALNRQPLSACSDADLRQVPLQSPHDLVNLETILCTGACGQAHAAVQLPPESPSIRDAHFAQNPQRDTEATRSRDLLPSSPISSFARKTALTRIQRNDSAKNHHMRDARGSDDEVFSESSVSVGSYFGPAPQAPTTIALGQCEDTPFTFSTMPDAGHGVFRSRKTMCIASTHPAQQCSDSVFAGSPENHCFKQTPTSLSSNTTYGSPNVARALFTDDSAPALAGSRCHDFAGTHSTSWYTRRTIKRLWQAVNLIVLTTSFAASICFLGRGDVILQQDRVTHGFLISAQQHLGHVFGNSISGTTINGTRAKLPPYMETQLPLSLLRSARQDLKHQITSMCDAAKQTAFRSSVVLSHRLGSLASYLIQGWDVAPTSANSSTPSLIRKGVAQVEPKHRTVEQSKNLDEQKHMGSAADIGADVAPVSIGSWPFIAGKERLHCLAPFVEAIVQQDVCDTLFDHESTQITTASEPRQHHGPSIVDRSDPERLQSTDAVVPSSHVLITKTSAPHLETADETASGEQGWTGQFKTVCTAGEDFTMAVVDVMYTNINESFCNVVSYCHQPSATLMQLARYIMLYAKTVFHSLGCSRLHGVDHPLVACAAIALIMSAMSVLLHLSHGGQVLQYDLDAALLRCDSEDEFYSARQLTPGWEPRPDHGSS